MIKRFAAALAGTTLLAALAGCARAVSESRPILPKEITAAPSAPPVRIMPLGDSITDGFGVPGGYRTDLWQYLTADGRTVQFVGSQYGGPPALGDRDHEGHSGWETAQLDRRVAAWLRTYRPDIVLLHIGTNDILHGKARRAPARLSALLAHIAAVVPGAEVFVATIVPLRDPRLEAEVRRYDRAIPKIVRARAAAGMRVRLVDMHAAIGTADLSPDGIHPAAGGYSKMAARWYAALRSSPMTRVEAENPANATVNDGERLDAASASGGRKVGYLDNADSFLQISLKATAPGWRRMYVRAANGTTTPCSQRLIVNGRPGGLLRYPAYGRDQWTITGADVRLNAGPNTIRLVHQTCSAEIDSVDLAPETGPVD